MSDLNQQSHTEYWLQRQERWLTLADWTAKMGRADLVVSSIRGYLDAVDALLRGM